MTLPFGDFKKALEERKRYCFFIWLGALHVLLKALS